jgi:hypothetical protein
VNLAWAVSKLGHSLDPLLQPLVHPTSSAALTPAVGSFGSGTGSSLPVQGPDVSQVNLNPRPQLFPNLDAASNHLQNPPSIVSPLDDLVAACEPRHLAMFAWALGEQRRPTMRPSPIPAGAFSAEGSPQHFSSSPTFSSVSIPDAPLHHTALIRVADEAAARSQIGLRSSDGCRGAPAAPRGRSAALDANHLAGIAWGLTLQGIPHSPLIRTAVSAAIDTPRLQSPSSPREPGVSGGPLGAAYAFGPLYFFSFSASVIFHAELLKRHH